MIITQSYLGQLELNLLTDLAKFVVEENFNHHCENAQSIELQNDVADICHDELKYSKNSKYFVAKDSSGNIQGSIRIIKWDYKTTLPIQKIFNINPLDTLDNQNSVSSIWHIGRFATSKKSDDKTLFKKLMVHAITPICKEKNSVAFAECDSKLLRVMNLMGIETQVIGKPINYLGSETIPVSMSSAGLKGFYESNKYLVTSTK